MTDGKTEAEQPTGEPPKAPPHEAPEKTDEVTYASDYERLKATQVEWLAFLRDRTIDETGIGDLERTVIETTRYRVETIWNAWRAEHPEELKPSLHRADCRKFFLREARLENADLREAQFESANLTDAHLENTNLMDAHLENANLADAHLENANLDTAHLESAYLYRANLQNAKLYGAHLENANLTAAVLENAHLSKAHLEKADLTEVTLQTGPEEGEKRHTETPDGEDAKQKKPVSKKRGIDLCKAIFCGATMPFADLHGLDLTETDFRDADLRNANLTKTKGLQPHYLGGADVSNAQLPEKIDKFDGLGVVKEASQNARKIFWGLLAACGYSLLAILGTEDLPLILNSSGSELPIIRTEIPTVSFYYIAPVLIAGMFVYLHLYLQRIWHELSRLPAVFPDGKSLNEKAYPWLLLGIAGAHVRRLQRDRPPFARLETFVAVILGWWAVPLTMYGFWTRALPRHDWVLTGLHLGLFGVTVLLGLSFYRSAARTLTHEHSARGKLARFLVPVPSGVRGWLRLVTNQVMAVAMVGILAASWIAINWRFDHGGDGIRPPDTWFYRPFAKLDNAELASKPAAWDSIVRAGNDTLIADAVSRIPRLDLQGRNLAGALLMGAFLHHAILRDADLRGAVLTFAHLRFADLDLADLIGAELIDADLRGAVLSLALLRDADLRDADLRLAVLSFADLIGADLRDADLRDADLSGADLLRADLRDADLRDADLRGALLDLKDVDRAHRNGAVCVIDGLHQVPTTTEEFVSSCQIRVFDSDGRRIPPDSVPARLAAYRASQGNQ